MVEQVCVHEVTVALEMCIRDRYYYGYGVAMSVASEKTSRVMETLVVSAKPSRILIGKCLAMGVLGLLQMVGIIAFALICYTAFVPSNFNIGGVPIDFSSITPFTLLILLVYFVPVSYTHLSSPAVSSRG